MAFTSHSYPSRNTTGKPEVSQVMDLDFPKTLTYQLTLIFNSTFYLKNGHILMSNTFLTAIAKNPFNKEYTIMK